MTIFYESCNRTVFYLYFVSRKYLHVHLLGRDSLVSEFTVTG